MMRCIQITEFGGPEVLKIAVGVAIPKPQARQVLVNVKAAGVNPVDTYIRSGNFPLKPTLPYIPGKDGAGIVHQVGPDVTTVKEGDRVWFTGSTTGSSAEYCLCDEYKIGVLPENYTFEQGAMLGIPYLTAYRALFQKAKVKRGETVFIHGATGGVGMAAVQLCQSFGVNVLASAGSKDGIDILSNMGVTKIFNHRSPNYIEEIKNCGTGIDVVLEMLANVNLQKDLDIIKFQGRISIIGNRGSLDFDPRFIMMKEASIIGVMLFGSSEAEQREQIESINEGLKSGWVAPVMWKKYELENAKDAHIEIIENSGCKGQFVLNVDQSS